MNKGRQPLLISVGITILSMVVGTVSYAALQSEEDSQQLVLGSLPTHHVAYTIKNGKGDPGCAGSFDISLDNNNNQSMVMIKGWIMVSLFGRAEPITFDASLAFNALGQLSASIFRTVSQYETIRFGTLGVNPITLRLYESSNDDSPLLEQSLPGPIELKPRDGHYEVIAPLYQNFKAPLHNIASPLSLEVGTQPSCDRATASPLDLTPFLKTAAALSDSVRRILPAP